MELREALSKILTEYRAASGEAFSGHPLANFIRREVPKLLRERAQIPDEYAIEGSAGQGEWARSPWIAILDPLVSDSAQRGYYAVYLFREDLTGVYLSLNQGVTDIRRIYGSNVKSALKARAIDYRSRIADSVSRSELLEIDLRPSAQGNYSADYEAGNIFASFYASAAMSTDSEIAEDLRAMLGLYAKLSYKENLQVGTIGTEDDEQDNAMIEDYAAFKLHKRIERNASLAARVKKIHGYICQACGFNFEQIYPGILKSKYIEAHHLTPISTLKGQRVSRDPKTDFAVLCANCHRMIHRFATPWDLDGFRLLIRRPIA